MFRLTTKYKMRLVHCGALTLTHFFFIEDSQTLLDVGSSALKTGGGGD
jgi:hypothetical protein